MGKGDFKNGEKEGAWVFYHKNGQLSAKGNYKNGNREGDWVTYSKDGTVWENAQEPSRTERRLVIRVF